jgi:hypothetical protein
MMVVVRRSRRNDSGVMRRGGLRRMGERRTNQNERQHPFAPCGDMPIPNNRQIVHRGAWCGSKAWKEWWERRGRRSPYLMDGG